MTYIPPSGRFNATISGNTAGAGSLVSAGTLSLVGGNNITLSQNGNAITISGANAPSGSINFSAGTTSGNLGSVRFSNSNGVSFGLNGSVITGSVATSYAASNHSHGNPTLNLTNISGTTASASNGLTLSLSAAAQSVQTQSNIQGVIAAGSTNRTGDVSFANSNGVTFGLSNNTITASVAAGGGVALSAAGGSITSGTASISAAGALTASVNGQTLSLSAPGQSNLSATGAVSISNNGNTISIGAPVQTNQTLGMYIASNSVTNATTSGTVDARSLTFRGVGNASVGVSNGSVIVSASGGGGGVALSAPGGSISSGTASVAAGGALSASVNGQTLSLNAPATSMLSAGDGISISTTGSTVVFQGVPTTGGAAVTYNYFNPQDAYLQVGGQQGNGTVHFQPSKLPNVQFDRLVMPLQVSNATNSTGSHTVSVHFGVYTRNNATLSLLSSVSTSFAATLSGTVGNYSLFGGPRLLTAGFTGSFPENQYYFGIMSRTSAGGNAGIYSQMLASQVNSNFSGFIGQAVSASLQMTRGLGHYSASSSVLPSSAAFSQIYGTASIVLRQPLFYLVSQTF